MKRRSFLKTAAAVFPADGFPAFAVGQTSASPSPAQASAQVHIVAAGQDRLSESHSRGYSSILFKVLPSETNSGLFIVEHDNLVKGALRCTSTCIRRNGSMSSKARCCSSLATSRKKLRAGDSVLGPRNVPHTLSSVGAKPGRMLIAFTPAGKMEEFLRVTAVPKPPNQDAAFFRRYEMELIGPSPLA